MMVHGRVTVRSISSKYCWASSGSRYSDKYFILWVVGGEKDGGVTQVGHLI
jgi:membrane-bound inhibitor of C-type lysozyme